jgi:hypothetical protein
VSLFKPSLPQITNFIGHLALGEMSKAHLFGSSWFPLVVLREDAEALIGKDGLLWADAGIIVLFIAAITAATLLVRWLIRAVYRLIGERDGWANNSERQRLPIAQLQLDIDELAERCAHLADIKALVMEGVKEAAKEEAGGRRRGDHFFLLSRRMVLLPPKIP